jgi:hypothetical protein
MGAHGARRARQGRMRQGRAPPERASGPHLAVVLHPLRQGLADRRRGPRLAERQRGRQAGGGRVPRLAGRHDRLGVVGIALEVGQGLLAAQVRLLQARLRWARGWNRCCAATPIPPAATRGRCCSGSRSTLRWVPGRSSCRSYASFHTECAPWPARFWQNSPALARLGFEGSEKQNALRRTGWQPSTSTRLSHRKANMVARQLGERAHGDRTTRQDRVNAGAWPGCQLMPREGTCSREGERTCSGCGRANVRRTASWLPGSSGAAAALPHPPHGRPTGTSYAPKPPGLRAQESDVLHVLLQDRSAPQEGMASPKTGRSTAGGCTGAGPAARRGAPPSGCHEPLASLRVASCRISTSTLPGGSCRRYGLGWVGLGWGEAEGGQG